MTFFTRSAASAVLVAVCASAAGCASSTGDEDGRLKVLAIGNSFSISVMRHLPAVASGCAKRLDVASLYIGGCSLERHWRNIEAAATNAAFRPYRYDRSVDGESVASGARRNIQEVLCAERWDIVVVQQVSHLSWKSESYSPFGDDLVAYIRAHAPQAEVVVQETWSYTPWDKRLAKWGISPAEMYAGLHEAYAAFAARHRLRVIPMGSAVEAWRKRLPVRYSENSFGGDVVGGRSQASRDQFKRAPDNSWKPNCDVFHLNEKGEYLQALVWAAFLFGPDSIDGLGYKPAFVSENGASLMREVAAKCVKTASKGRP